jgi:hypothetical protein
MVGLKNCFILLLEVSGQKRLIQRPVMIFTNNPRGQALASHNISSIKPFLHVDVTFGKAASSRTAKRAHGPMPAAPDRLRGVRSRIGRANATRIPSAWILTVAAHVGVWGSACSVPHSSRSVLGSSDPMDKSFSAHYFKLAADQGHAHAQFKYGFLLDTGDGVPMNKSLSVHYYKLAANQGHVYARLRWHALRAWEPRLNASVNKANTPFHAQ